jgi:hypothetical protein
MSPFFRGRQKRVLNQIPLAGWHISDSLLCVHPELWVTVGANEKSPILARFLCDNTYCAMKNHIFRTSERALYSLETFPIPSSLLRSSYPIL